MNELAKTLAQAEKNRPSAINRLLSSVKNAAKEQWQQGEPYRAAVGGLLMGDVAPARDVLMQKSPVTPMTIENALNIALDWSSPMGMIGHTVYHGSPHKFNKFDMSKIGTGEGAQAYGHGLYFAESPDVARSYKEVGKTVRYTPTQDKFTSNGWEYRTGQNGEKYKFRDYVKNDAPTPVSGDEYLSEYQKIKSIFDSQNEGSLYKVDIPDEVIPKMLDWDKPLKDQPEILKKLKNNGLLNEIMKDGGWSKRDIDSGLMKGQHLQPSHFKKTTKPERSNQLKDLGIPGIRYLDGGSRGTGQGSYNYVVFDDSLPKILEINGKKVAK